MKIVTENIFKKIDDFLHARTGSLTQDLVQRPGDYGLGRVPERLAPKSVTTSICGFCSTGCSLKIHLDANGEAINLSPDTNYPVNLGMACPKGWEALAPLAATDRATTPLLRNAAGQLEPISWAQALDVFCTRFKDIQAEHGAESLAYISTGQIPTEEMALLGSLAKFGMGLVHGDGNTRQCMATAVVAYKEAFGFDAPPFTYGDFEESDVLVFVGSNLCIAHPIMWQRVLRNPHSPEIIVLDPRKTETAMAATQHLALNPKSDLILLYGLAHLLIENGAVAQEFIDQHTTGFDEFRVHVAAYPPEKVSAQTGLSEAELRRCAESIARGKRVSFWWTMGVNQSHEGVRVAQAIINLALMTGNIGRPGTGANSITGQCNAMGSRLFSNTTNLLGGHSFLEPTHRQKIADILQIDVARIPGKNSLAYDQILDAVEAEKIKGLWIIATNTAHSWINQNSVRELRKKLKFLVVQDMYATTETAQMADLVLPAAGWGEKDGTFINSERRIGTIKKVAKAPGQALSDFNIFRLIAQAWGCGELFARWKSPADAFQIMKEISRNQPCDMSGMADYAAIDQAGGMQWPLAEGEKLHEQERRLFSDGQFFHADKKAKFIWEASRPMEEPVEADYPFLLLTGRGSSAQWHTQTRTGKSAVLRQLGSREVYVEINPVDAARLQVAEDQTVQIVSRRGQLSARAFITATVKPGQVFMPMHEAVTNQLTHANFDPYSRQPGYKASAVRIEV